MVNMFVAKQKQQDDDLKNKRKTYRKMVSMCVYLYMMISV